MKVRGLALGLLVGLLLGVVGTAFCINPIRRVSFNNDANLLHAGSNDRSEEYIMCTGAVAVNPRAPTDGVWVLDYRGGKLMGTVIDRVQGRITGWAEVNLVKEFDIPPKQSARFMMTTGTIAQGQAALYVAEVESGKFGIYTLGPDPAGGASLIIRRHDLTTFRKN